MTRSARQCGLDSKYLPRLLDTFQQILSQWDKFVSEDLASIPLVTTRWPDSLVSDPIRATSFATGRTTADSSRYGIPMLPKP